MRIPACWRGSRGELWGRSFLRWSPCRTFPLSSTSKLPLSALFCLRWVHLLETESDAVSCERRFWICVGEHIRMSTRQLPRGYRECWICELNIAMPLYESQTSCWRMRSIRCNGEIIDGQFNSKSVAHG